MFFSGHVKSLVDYVGLPEPPAGKRPLHFKKDVTIKILNNSDQQWWKVRKHFINSHYCIYVVGVGFFQIKRPQIQLRPHHFWIYTSNLATVVNSVLKFMI